MKQIIYRCDPYKNITCKKTSCKYLNKGDCTGTKNPKFAMIDRNCRTIIQEIYDDEESENSKEDK